MKLLKLSLLACIAMFSANVMAASTHPDNPDIKNGMPCFKDICIGDELQDLSYIHWNGQIISNGQAKFLANQNMSAINETVIAPESVKKSLAVYLGLSSGDINSKMVELLAQVDAFCKNPMGDIKGRYEDHSKGFTTTVVFRALSNEAGKKQRLVATSIARYFDGRYSSAQIDGLYQDLSARYSSIETDNRSSTIVRVDGGIVIRMKYIPLSDDNKLMDYPGCTKKLDM